MKFSYLSPPHFAVDISFCLICPVSTVYSFSWRTWIRFENVDQSLSAGAPVCWPYFKGSELSQDNCSIRTPLKHAGNKGSHLWTSGLLRRRWYSGILRNAPSVRCVHTDINLTKWIHCIVVLDKNEWQTSLSNASISFIPYVPVGCLHCPSLLPGSGQELASIDWERCLYEPSKPCWFSCSFTLLPHPFPCLLNGCCSQTRSAGGATPTAARPEAWWWFHSPAPVPWPQANPGESASSVLCTAGFPLPSLPEQRWGKEGSKESS